MLYVNCPSYKSRWSPCEHKRRLKNVKRHNIVIPDEMWNEIFCSVNPKDLFTLSCVNKNFNEILSTDIPWKNVVHNFYWYKKLSYDERKMLGQWKMAAKILVSGLAVKTRKWYYFVITGDTLISNICGSVNDQIAANRQRSLNYLRPVNRPGPVNRPIFCDRKMSMIIKLWKTERVNYEIEHEKILTFDNGFEHKIKITSDATNEKNQFEAENMSLLELLMRIGCLSPYKIKIQLIK
jgi:hypothetical protein